MAPVNPNPTDSQYGQLRDSMPPPPRRRNKQDLSEDSQLGRVVDGQEKESSAVSGAVPLGFFDSAVEKPRSKKMKKSESNEDFHSFMQEISAMGAVKHQRDGTVCVVSDGDRGDPGDHAEQEEEQRRAHRGGPDHTHDENEDGERREDEGSVDISEKDDGEDFEQFVRRERLKEVKQAVQNRTRPHDQESHQEMMAQISAVASNNAVRLPDVSLPGRQSVVESFNQHMQAASDSNGSESSEEDWRSKKL